MKNLTDFKADEFRMVRVQIITVIKTHKVHPVTSLKEKDRSTTDSNICINAGLEKIFHLGPATSIIVIDPWIKQALL